MCNDFLPMYSQQNCTAASHHLWKVAWILLTEQRECFPLRGPHPHTRSGILSCSWELFFVLILFLNLCGKGLPKNLHLCLRKATESTGEFRKKFHWKQLPILWNNSMFFFQMGDAEPGNHICHHSFPTSPQRIVDWAAKGSVESGISLQL